MHLDELLSMPLHLIDGTTCDLSYYDNQVLLVVNTASRCGLTPQLAELEVLYKKYRKHRVSVLGFPCNQFLYQEPGNHQEIANFCQLNFRVSFPLFHKVKVNGSDAHPLFQYLKKQAPGFMGSSSVKWNFTKFLVHPDRKQIRRFSPSTRPVDLEPWIDKWLEETGEVLENESPEEEDRGLITES